MAVRNLYKFAVLLSLVGMFSVCAVQAQTQPAPKAPTSPATQSVAPLTPPAKQTAPQVVTIIHRLNGLKMFRLLIRSDQEVQAISEVDEAFKLLDDVHTTVIAGLAMDDGQTIAARLPEAEVEFGPPTVPFTAPRRPNVPNVHNVPPASPTASGSMLPREVRRLAFGSFNVPEVTVIGPDGKHLTATFVGLDGVTGLSILKLAGQNLRVTALANENQMDVGQNLRVFGPEPVPTTRALTGGNLFVRMGETNAKISKVTRGPSGAIARLNARSLRMNVGAVGGVAVNTAGEAVGIVDAIDGAEASILPADSIRRAVQRVLAQQASVPKPWLGVKGEPVTALKLAQMESLGWQSDQASMLFQDPRGILLTSIAPGSPAAQAALTAGDVILKVDDKVIRNGDDFSWSLEQAGPSNSVRFTVVGPKRKAEEAVSVRLSGALDTQLPFRAGVRLMPTRGSSLLELGIETIGLRPAVASRFGALTGLLVVYVEPATPAFEAGFQPGDLIQTIDGKPIDARRPMMLPATASTTHSFEVIRSKQKIVFTLDTAKKEK